MAQIFVISGYHAAFATGSDNLVLTKTPSIGVAERPNAPVTNSCPVSLSTVLNDEQVLTLRQDELA